MAGRLTLQRTSCGKMRRPVNLKGDLASLVGCLSEVCQWLCHSSCCCIAAAIDRLSLALDLLGLGCLGRLHPLPLPACACPQSCLQREWELRGPLLQVDFYKQSGFPRTQ